MTDIAELVIRIKADAAQLEREMQKANGIVKQSAGEMGGSFGKLKQQILELAPAISAVAFVEFGRRAVDAAGHMVDLADRIGFAASTLSALEIPLTASGSNLDEFSAAVNKMNNLLGEAAKGNEEAVKAFDGLGLSVRRLRALSPEDQFYAIASAIGQITDQNKQTEAGMNIFGRGFASLIPLLKEYGGDMRKAVEAQEKLKASLDDQLLKRVDAFGDSLSAAAIKTRNEFLKLFGVILQVTDAIGRVTAKPATNAKSGLPGDNSAFQYGPNLPKGTASSDRPDVMSWAEVQKTLLQAKGGEDAKGSNKDLLGLKEKAEAAKKLADAKKTLDEFNTSLERQNVILQQTPREQAALEAGYRTMDLAAKAGIKDANDLIEANMNLARTNYDLAQSMQEAARFQQELHDKLSSSLTDIAFKAGSAKDAMLGFADSIARAAFEKKIAGPLSDALIGTGGSKGLLDNLIGSGSKILGFADGGSPPVGIPSIVGERGPEIFVPRTAGAIVPNGKIGGTSVNVYQTFNMQPGLAETVGAAIRAAAPAIAAQSKQMILAGARSGGLDSQALGLRS